MKKNDWILLATTLAYSFLFYRQEAGINFTIFSYLLVGILYFKKEAPIKDMRWQAAAVGTLLSSLCIGYYGNWLSIWANFISLMLLSALSTRATSSPIVGVMLSGLSMLGSVVFSIVDLFARVEKQKKVDALEKKSKIRFSLILIPILFTILFFFFYRGVSPIFNEYAKRINLDFISMLWILFTLGGFLLLYGFFYHKKKNALANYEDRTPDIIRESEIMPSRILGKLVSVKEEAMSAIILFVLLNLLILSVLVIDFNYIFTGKKLPEGVDIKYYVHQGVGILIFSIISAISLIAFYFKGQLNFSNNKWLKPLVYLWVLQNAGLLFIAGYRNYLYVIDFGLTYKRIGVYIYLLLCFIGLVLTIKKLAQNRTSYFLFRANGWAFYLVLVLSSLVNWDSLITKFNITTSNRQERHYLLNLPDVNIPELIRLQYQDPNDPNVEDEKKDHYPYYSRSDKRDEYRDLSFENGLHRKIYNFLSSHNSLSWKSWNYMDTETKQEILKLNQGGYITELSIRNLKECSYPVLSALGNLKKLDLSHIYTTGLSLKGISKLNTLEELDLSNRILWDYEDLFKLTHLRKLTLYRAGLKGHEKEHLKEVLLNTEIHFK